MNFAIELPYFYIFFCIIPSEWKTLQSSVCVKQTHRCVFFFSGHAQRQNKIETELCESGNVFIVFARKMCNIRFSDGSRFQRRTPIFNCFLQFLSFFPVSSSGHVMPSGPEGDQEISELTLMHPKYKTTGFYFGLVSLFFSFLPDFFFLFVCLFLWQFSQTVYFSFFLVIFRLTHRHLLRCPFPCLLLYYCYLLHM